MKKIYASVLALFVCTSSFYAENLALTKVSLFSSGIGLFEHQGLVGKDGRLELTIPNDAINDVLKSLILIETDRATKGEKKTSGSSSSIGEVLIEYSGATSSNALHNSLKIDVSGNPGMAELFMRLVGEIVRVQTPSVIEGRILGVEPLEHATDKKDFRLLLSTTTGLKTILGSEIVGFAFIDSAITNDLEKGLDVIKEQRSAQTKKMTIHVPGAVDKKIRVLYIAPTAVWKTSYRLQFLEQDALLQAWAIVDNASAVPWNNIQLSLVSGRPISFIQNLYDPYFIAREEVALGIAGSAKANVFDSGFDDDFYSFAEASSSPSLRALVDVSMAKKESSVQAHANLTGIKSSASTEKTGEQYYFDITKPVELGAYTSSMLPIAQGSIAAERVTVVSSSASSPTMLSAYIKNTLETPLPAGAITVLDSGLYAGDALINYLPAGESRYIAYGEDLLLDTIITDANGREERNVTIANGVLHIRKANVYEKTYTLKNLDTKAKTIMIEHEARYGTELKTPTKPDEQIAGGYRFRQTVPAGKQIRFVVKEEQALVETITLLQTNEAQLLSYSTLGNISPKAKTALSKAISFKQAHTEAQKEVQLYRNEKEELIKGQERIRLNLEAFGRSSVQGADYIQRLIESDKDIQDLEILLAQALKKEQATKKAFDEYVVSLNLE